MFTFFLTPSAEAAIEGEDLLTFKASSVLMNIFALIVYCVGACVSPDKDGGGRA